MNNNKKLNVFFCSFFYTILLCFCMVAQLNAQPPAINKGFGFSVDSSKEGIIVIKYVMKTSPAENAGLKTGDLVISVNNKKIKNYSAEQFLDYLIIQPDNDNTFEIKSKAALKTVKINKMAVTSFYDKCLSGDCQNGFGKKNMKNGSYYEGNFLNGKQHGKGKLEKTDGGVYEGEFKDDKAFGQGKIKTWEGNVFEGIWDENPKTGKGVFLFANGNKYDGEIRDGLRNGYGILSMINGSVYDGNFVNDRATGKGVFIYPNGKKYTGDFVNSKKEGHGVITWPNGDKYTGEFKNDSTHGAGEMFTFSTQKTIKYDLVNGIMQPVVNGNDNGNAENQKDEMIVKYNDDFTTKKYWQSFDETFTKIADGKLTIASIAGKTIDPYYRPFVRATDFSVSVEATHISGIDNNAFGFFIRSADATEKEHKELILGISAGGRYSINYGDKTLVDWKINDNIKKNNGTNTLMIKRIGNTYSLYINNVLVETFNNLFTFEYFDVGMMTVDKQTVEFDNLIIKAK